MLLLMLGILLASMTSGLSEDVGRDDTITIEPQLESEENVTRFPDETSPTPRYPG